MPALAEPGRVIKETFHEEFFNEIEAFCDTDMVVRAIWSSTGPPRSGRVGAIGLIYFANRLEITETFTNVDNDKFVVSTVNLIDKDLRVTDNGDGTLTILIRRPATP